jgi:hypothetical protein
MNEGKLRLGPPFGKSETSEICPQHTGLRLTLQEEKEDPKETLECELEEERGRRKDVMYLLP